MSLVRDPLEYSPVGAQDFGDARLNELHLDVRRTDGTWRAAREQGVEHAQLRELVQAYADAAHAFQKARWGKVRTKLSVSVILRLSR